MTHQPPIDTSGQFVIERDTTPSDYDMKMVEADRTVERIVFMKCNQLTDEHVGAVNWGDGILKEITIWDCEDSQFTDEIFAYFPRSVERIYIKHHRFDRDVSDTQDLLKKLPKLSVFQTEQCTGNVPPNFGNVL